MVGELEKRIRNLNRIPEEYIVNDVLKVVDEAKKEFPKFKVINAGDDQMVIDSYIDEFFDWFDKWLGE